VRFQVVKMKPIKVPETTKVRLVATIPPALMEGLEDLQRRLRQKTYWKARNATSLSALVREAIQEYLHAHS